MNYIDQQKGVMTLEQQGEANAFFGHFWKAIPNLCCYSHALESSQAQENSKHTISLFYYLFVKISNWKSVSTSPGFPYAAVLVQIGPNYNSAQYKAALAQRIWFLISSSQRYLRALLEINCG